MLPLISCVTIELYSRKVTRRFVGLLTGSVSGKPSVLRSLPSNPGDCGVDGVVGVDGGEAGVGVCDFKQKRIKVIDTSDSKCSFSLYISVCVYMHSHMTHKTILQHTEQVMKHQHYTDINPQ